MPNNSTHTANYNRERAEKLFAAGYEPIPIPPGTKKCTLLGWPTMDLPIRPWPAGHGIGLRTGRHVGIDLDIYDEAVVSSLIATISEDYAILTRTGQPPKTLVPVICREVEEKIVSRKYLDGAGRKHSIELLTHGQMYVAHAVHPDTGKPYEWSGDLLDHSLPITSLDYIEWIFGLFYDHALARGWTRIDTVKQAIPERSDPVDADGTRPGDVFNATHQIIDLLPQYGWSHHSGNKWTRPGKAPKAGSSAAILDNRLYVFSTNADPLLPDTMYAPFALYVAYEFGGDWSAAAKILNEIMRAA